MGKRAPSVIRVTIYEGSHWSWRKFKLNHPFGQDEWSYEKFDDDEFLVPDLESMTEQERCIANSLMGIEDIFGFLMRRKALYIEIDTNRRRWDHVTTSILEMFSHVLNAPLEVSCKPYKEKRRPYRVHEPGAAFITLKTVDEVTSFQPHGLRPDQLAAFRQLRTSEWERFLRQHGPTTTPSGQ